MNTSSMKRGNLFALCLAGVIAAGCRPVAVDKAKLNATSSTAQNGAPVVGRYFPKKYRFAVASKASTSLKASSQKSVSAAKGLGLADTAKVKTSTSGSSQAQRYPGVDGGWSRNHLGYDQRFIGETPDGRVIAETRTPDGVPRPYIGTKNAKGELEWNSVDSSVVAKMQDESYKAGTSALWERDGKTGSALRPGTTAFEDAAKAEAANLLKQGPITDKQQKDMQQKWGDDAGLAAVQHANENGPDQKIVDAQQAHIDSAVRDAMAKEPNKSQGYISNEDYNQIYRNFDGVGTHAKTSDAVQKFYDERRKAQGDLDTQVKAALADGIDETKHDSLSLTAAKYGLDLDKTIESQRAGGADVVAPFKLDRKDPDALDKELTSSGKTLPEYLKSNPERKEAVTDYLSDRYPSSIPSDSQGKRDPSKADFTKAISTAVSDKNRGDVGAGNTALTKTVASELDQAKTASMSELQKKQEGLEAESRNPQRDPSEIEGELSAVRAQMKAATNNEFVPSTTIPDTDQCQTTGCYPDAVGNEPEERPAGIPDTAVWNNETNSYTAPTESSKLDGRQWDGSGLQTHGFSGSAIEKFEGEGQDETTTTRPYPGQPGTSENPSEED